MVFGGNGVATGPIGAETKLRVVAAIFAGTHELGTSRHAMVGAFLDEPNRRRTR
jgi:hypothetical protein